jgi:nucleoside-diphosphate-sugar epimerase
MSKVLVIGGTGPTGPFIVNGLLRMGHTVTVLHRGNHEVPYDQEIEHIHTDPHFAEPLTAALQGRTFDTVVATYGRVRLFPEILRGKTERLVTVGGATYQALESRAAAETDPKITGLKLYDKMNETEDVLMAGHKAGWYSLTHLRYPNIYGPRQLAPTDWSIIRRIRDGRRRLLVVDGGLMLRTRAYAGNAAHVVLLAVQQPQASAGEFFNVADSASPSEADRVRKIAAVLGAQVELVSVPAAVKLPAHYPGISRSMRVKGIGEPRSEHELLSIAKAEKLLGYVAPWSIDTAIEATVKWYQANPLPAGGEVETTLGDPFNYEAEDQLLAQYDQFTGQLDTSALGGEYRHPYAHPKEAAAATPAN